MAISRSDLEERFRFMGDDELVRRYRSGDLTDLALDIAGIELERRGLHAHEALADDPEGDPGDGVGHGDLLILIRYSIPTEAHLLRGCLEAEGVPAFVADANLVQANQFLSNAVGGVRVLVPESHFDEAKAILKAFNAGAYALDEDEDFGDVEI